jgi:hypothetical protein
VSDHPLVAFYAARLDEEEAQAAGPPGWKLERWTLVRCADRESGRHWRVDAEPRCVVDGALREDAEFIVTHDPAAVLAGILADRRILARWTALQSPVTLMDRVTFPSLAEVVLACIADRAARFRDHPGYDPSWSRED